MQITFEVPDNRADFILELLRSLPFVTLLETEAESEMEQGATEDL